MMQMLGSFAEFVRDMAARANPRQAQGGSRTGPKGQSASKPMAHQRTEILATARAGADIARISRCIAPRLAASQPRREPLPVRRADEPVFIELVSPTQLAVETQIGYEKADSLMISTGCHRGSS